MKTNDLTLKEKEILELVSQGKSYKKIAHAIKMPLRTVKFHMGHAREKLGAYNSSHAVAIFVKSYESSIENRQLYT